MRAATIIVALALLPSTADAATRARYLMGTVCEVAAADERQIEAAFAEARRIEEMLSTWIEGSELSRVNRGETPGPELRALLDETLRWSEKTDRAFDPRIGHLTRPQRGLDCGSAAAALHCGGDAAAKRAVASPPQSRTSFDEGAFGKGYALDRMLPLLDGEATINFGGQILVRGTSEVSIADPEDRDKPVIAFAMTNASLSTSSGSHIFDPRTGKPITWRGSASVIAGDALTADILSTALAVMGEDDGLRWAAANGVAAIFLTPSHTVRLSPEALERAQGLVVLDRKFTLKD